MKGIFFDLYGTLIEVVVDENSHSLWEKMSSFVGNSGIVTSSDSLQEMYKLYLKKYRENHPDGMVLDFVFKEMSRTIRFESYLNLALKFREFSIVNLATKNYCYDLLHKVRKSNHYISIISNTEALLTDYDIAATGLEPLVNDIILSSRIKVKKPDPGIFTYAIEKANINHNSVVYVGDNLEDDIIGAQNSGIKSLYVNPLGDHFSRTKIRKEPTVVGVAPDLQEIVNALRLLGFPVA